MRRLLERVFGLYGKNAVLISGSVQKQVKVFLQGSNSKSWQNMQRVYSPLGEIPRGQYLCLLQPGVATEGDTLMLDGKAHRICRVEEMTAGSNAMYQWCLCTGKGGADTWALTE